MNFYIQQSINIQYLRVGSVSNSSVLQIGSAGMIKPLSNLYNTGGFTGPAPLPKKPGVGVVEPSSAQTLVPLQPPASS
ncbi:spore germination protein GerPB [Bacillus sp. FJAT-47783]|uniref:spore germination protein GerPB n=1 Tax=Bacillus sp. FJAT-47783 TaxID=2922712 RepID=UPI001FAB52C1|nr:spore germination protein GerPB [Bacillus sp. FJAT-47783]